MRKSGEVAVRVASVVCAVVPISVGAAVSSGPTPMPAQSTPPEPPCRKHDAREAATPLMGLVQFE